MAATTLERTLRGTKYHNNKQFVSENDEILSPGTAEDDQQELTLLLLLFYYTQASMSQNGRACWGYEMGFGI